MEKLIEEVENLKNVIDNRYAQEFNMLNKNVKEDTNLMSLIKEYRKTNDDKIKKEIMNNSLFQEYKEKETEINLIIMNINTKLKNLKDNKECSI